MVRARLGSGLTGRGLHGIRGAAARAARAGMCQQTGAQPTASAAAVAQTRGAVPAEGAAPAAAAALQERVIKALKPARDISVPYFKGIPSFYTSDKG